VCTLFRGRRACCLRLRFASLRTCRAAAPAPRAPCAPDPAGGPCGVPCSFGPARCQDTTCGWFCRPSSSEISRARPGPSAGSSRRPCSARTRSRRPATAWPWWPSASTSSSGSRRGCKAHGRQAARASRCTCPSTARSGTPATASRSWAAPRRGSTLRCPSATASPGRTSARRSSSTRSAASTCGGTSASARARPAPRRPRSPCRAVRAPVDLRPRPARLPQSLLPGTLCVLRWAPPRRTGKL